MEPLVEFAKGSNASIEEAIAGIKNLSFQKSGKENAKAKQSATTVLQCLKSAQKRLSQPTKDTPQLIALCQSCLRHLERDPGSLKPSQLRNAAYSTIRLLVSAQAFLPAFQEATRLYQSICDQYTVAITGIDTHPKSKPSTPTSTPTIPVDVANVAVGAILSMAVCWAAQEEKETNNRCATEQQFEYLFNSVLPSLSNNAWLRYVA